MEVVNKSSWEFFHPDEILMARVTYGNRVQRDTAAGLNYFRLKHKRGFWVSCECAFTIAYDVLVATTSIYQRGSRSESEMASPHFLMVGVLNRLM